MLRLRENNAGYKDGIAKTALVELFEKLGSSNPDVRTYRRKLATSALVAIGVAGSYLQSKLYPDFPL